MIVSAASRYVNGRGVFLLGINATLTAENTPKPSRNLLETSNITPIVSRTNGKNTEYGISPQLSVVYMWQAVALKV